MNQALKSVVETMAPNSDEYIMVQSLCAHAVDESVISSKAGKWAEFRKLLLKVGSIFSESIEFCAQTIFFFLNQKYKQGVLIMRKNVALMLVWWTQIELFRHICICLNRRRPLLLFQWIKSEIYCETRIQVSTSHVQLLLPFNYYF